MRRTIFGFVTVAITIAATATAMPVAFARMARFVAIAPGVGSRSSRGFFGGCCVTGTAKEEPPQPYEDADLLGGFGSLRCFDCNAGRWRQARDR
jgi:hypothetical protein